MLFGLSLDTIAILWLGALVGGIAAGGSGFAFALAASSIWLHRIDPLHSAIMCTGCGVLLHLTTIWPQRKNIEAGRLWPFLAGGFAGVPIGVRLLAFTDGSVLKMVLGVFLIAFGLYAFIAPRLHTISAGGRGADAAVGFIGGILGGIGGYSGVLPTIWTQLRGWPKETARGVYQPYIIVIQGITLAGIILVTFDRQGLVLMLEVLPPLLLGTWIGWQLYGRLNERRFRQILAVLLMGSGLTLVL
ncbi:MAG TPA: sulfite exporter TauE/SafE family protein [Pseudolabrys sp.]|nr:sulfite exporter TauE/SafE family protein [Pseudolabrys sp.]